MLFKITHHNGSYFWQGMYLGEQIPLHFGTQDSSKKGDAIIFPNTLVELECDSCQKDFIPEILGKVVDCDGHWMAYKKKSPEPDVVFVVTKIRIV